jgi:LemA protein
MIAFPHRERGAVRGGLLVLLAVLVLLLLMGGCQYNSLVGSQQKVKASWSEIDNQYQRRYELIPNLVETVKGAAEFERGTLEAVTQARAQVGRVQLPADVPTDPEKLAAYIQAQQQLGGALARLLVVAEQYPQLKATANFAALQDQLEGTENRIAVARRDYIDASREFNTKVLSFPANLVAKLLGFQPVAPLEVPAEQRTPPKVDFDTKKK